MTAVKAAFDVPPSHGRATTMGGYVKHSETGI